MRGVPQRWRARPDADPEQNLRLVNDFQSQTANGLAGIAPRVVRDLIYRAPERWIAPTLLNSWVNTGGSYATAGFWKDERGVVTLRGRVRLGTYGILPMFTLPDGFAPAATQTFPVTQSSIMEGPGQLAIASDGSVTAPAIVSVQTGVSTYLSLDGVSFDAADLTPPRLSSQPLIAGLGLPGKATSLTVQSCRDVTLGQPAPPPRIAWQPQGGGVLLTQFFGLLPGHQYALRLEIGSQ